MDSIYLWWSGGGGGGEGETPMLKGQGCLSYLLAVKKVVLVSLRVSSLLSFFRTFYGIEPKKYDR